MIIKIKKLHNDATIPTRANHDDAGIDLYSCSEVAVAPHETCKMPTGIACKIEKGYVGLIWDKSSIGSQGLKILGGVVDAGYRGEISVIIHNLSDTTYVFSKGHKVAQMLIQKVELATIEVVEDLGESVRGEKGFGSTGK